MSQDIYAAHFHGDAQYNDFPNIEFIHDLRKKDKYIYANLTFEKLRCSIVNKSNWKEIIECPFRFLAMQAQDNVDNAVYCIYHEQAV